MDALGLGPGAPSRRLGFISPQRLLAGAMRFLTAVAVLGGCLGASWATHTPDPSLMGVLSCCPTAPLPATDGVAKRRRLSLDLLPHHDLANAFASQLARRPEEAHLRKASPFPSPGSSHDASSGTPPSIQTPHKFDYGHSSRPGVRLGDGHTLTRYRSHSPPAAALLAAPSYTGHLASEPQPGELRVSKRGTIGQQISIVMARVAEFCSKKQTLLGQPIQLPIASNLPPEISEALPGESDTYRVIKREFIMEPQTRQGALTLDHYLRLKLDVVPLPRGTQEGELRYNLEGQEASKKRVLCQVQPHMKPALQTLRNHMSSQMYPPSSHSSLVNPLALILDWNVFPASSPSTSDPGSTTEHLKSFLKRYYCGRRSCGLPSIDLSHDEGDYCKVLCDIDMHQGTQRANLLHLNERISSALAAVSLEAPKDEKLTARGPASGIYRWEPLEKYATYSIVNCIILIYALFTPFKSSHILEMKSKLELFIDQTKDIWLKLRQGGFQTQWSETEGNPLSVSNQAYATLRRQLDNLARYKQVWIMSREVFFWWCLKSNPQKFSFLQGEGSGRARLAFYAFLKDCAFTDWLHSATAELG